MNVVKMNNNHSEYPITNSEWVRNDSDDTLCVYLSIRLDIRKVVVSRDFGRFGGIRDYYVRNCYGVGYTSCSSKCVGGVFTGRAVLDPWNRCFKVFPYDRRNMGKYSYEGYYSDVVYVTVYGDEDKGKLSEIRHNVMLLTTTVNGCMVYCVDILAGVYKGV
jgi:hypothetical protein